MNYSRIVIALKNDKSGFGLNGRTPAGRSIVETKGDEGKISLQVQDLKSESIYKIYMISASKQSSKGLHIGNLEVNSKGKGEFKKEFDKTALSSMPLNIKDINTIAIFSGEEKNKNIPLSGSKNEDINWKNNFFIVNIKTSPKHEEKPKEIVKPFPKTIEKDNTPTNTTEKTNVIPVPMENNYKMTDTKDDFLKATVIEKKPPIEISNEEKDILLDSSAEKKAIENKAIVSDAEKWHNKDSSKGSELEEIKKQENRKNRKKNRNSSNENSKSADSFAKSEDFFKDLPKEEPNINIPEANIQDNFKSVAKQLNKEIDELDYITFEYDEPINKQEEPLKDKETQAKAGDYSKNKAKLPKNELDNLFEQNPKMQPFEQQIKNIKWVKTTMKDLALLPIDFWRLMNHPFIMASYKKYNHLMFGEREGKNKTYFLAVPSLYENDYKETANLLGFTQFKSCSKQKNEDGSFGYWIMTI